MHFAFAAAVTCFPQLDIKKDKYETGVICILATFFLDL